MGGSRSQAADRRRDARRSARWRGGCRLLAAGFDGAILDITAHGVFFALADAEAAERLGRLLLIDRRVALRFDDAPGLEGLELPGHIRWSGYSIAHQRYGCGVEFSHRPLI